MSGTSYLPLPCLECLSEVNSHSPFLLTCGVLGSGATKVPGQLNVCSFPSCFTVAVGQCSEQVSLEVYGQEVWESADMIWSDMKGPARLAGPLPSSLPSSIFYQNSHLLLSSRIAIGGAEWRKLHTRGGKWNILKSSCLQWHHGALVSNRPPLGKPFYLVFCCKQLNLLWLLYVFFPTLKMKTKKLYGWLLLIIWDAVENVLHKEVFPGHPIYSSSSFHVPGTSLFHCHHHISTITWNYRVHLFTSWYCPSHFLQN